MISTQMSLIDYKYLGGIFLDEKNSLLSESNPQKDEKKNKKRGRLYFVTSEALDSVYCYSLPYQKIKSYKELLETIGKNSSIVKIPKQQWSKMFREGSLEHLGLFVGSNISV